MTLIEFGAVGEVLGAVGVIISLIYLSLSTPVENVTHVPVENVTLRREVTSL